MGYSNKAYYVCFESYDSVRREWDTIEKIVRARDEQSARDCIMGGVNNSSRVIKEVHFYAEVPFYGLSAPSC